MPVRSGSARAFCGPIRPRSALGLWQAALGDASGGLSFAPGRPESGGITEAHGAISASSRAGDENGQDALRRQPSDLRGSGRLVRARRQDPSRHSASARSTRSSCSVSFDDAPVPYEGEPASTPSRRAEAVRLERDLSSPPRRRRDSDRPFQGDGANVSLEPGGQFELSGAPLATMHDICEETGAAPQGGQDGGAELGLGFLGVGFAPIWRRDRCADDAEGPLRDHASATCPRSVGSAWT